MIRTFQFRLLPNSTQRKALEYALADNCETYNAALQERRDAWRLERKSITYRMQQEELTELRKDERFTVVACHIQRDPLKRVDRAFRAFFRRCKCGYVPGFPRFRSRDRYNSFGFESPAVRENTINIPNIGRVRSRGGRSVVGSPKFCIVKRHGKRWTASIAADIGATTPQRTVSRAVGIDVGLTTLATLSDGTEISNPRWTKQHEDRLAAANQALARKQRRSKNRIRAREALQRVHERAANARTNYLHHVSKWLISHYDLIAFEDLKIKNMVRSNLAKGIMDAAWGQLIGQLKYKAENAGTWMIPVNPYGTTVACSGCGCQVRKTLAERQHDCPECGLSLSRDHNAALNILALGMSAAGVKPSEHVINYMSPRAVAETRRLII